MGKSRPPIERLMEKVRLLDNGCWEWTQHMDSKGYARLWVDRRNVGAHRFSYEYHVGPIPDGLQIDHLCHYPSCVNPEHLEPVTALENARRRRPWVPYQLLKTHCPEGHPYDEENTYTYTGSGGRACLICKRENARKFYERNREITIERARIWRLENLERSRELSREGQRRYRAKKKAA